MAGPKGVNTYLTQELSGTTKLGDYAGAADNKARIDVLLAMIEPEEAVTVYRGQMDEMSPMARIQLIVELRALKAAVTNAT